MQKLLLISRPEIDQLLDQFPLHSQVHMERLMDRQIDPVGQMHVDSAARLSIAMNLSFTNCFIGVMFVLGVPLNNNIIILFECYTMRWYISSSSQ